MQDLSGNKKILIVRLGKIGDIIITSSVFNILKNKFPGIHISLITLKKNRDVLKYNPNIDKIYFTNKNILLYLLLFRLKRTRYDLILDLNDDPSRTSGTIRKILQSEETAGFDFNITPKPGIAVRRPDKGSTHIIERIRTLLHEVGIEPGKDDLKPVLFLGKSELKEVKAQLKKDAVKSRIIAINLSAGAPIRYWPVEKWNELINRITKKYTDYRFLLLSTTTDKILRKKISNTIPDTRLIPQIYDSFQHYASYICNSDLLISADTSAVHIASSFNKPQIVLFPGVEWNFVSWKPLSDNSSSIRSTEESIAAIPVDKVWESFEEIIKKI